MDDRNQTLVLPRPTVPVEARPPRPRDRWGEQREAVPPADGALAGRRRALSSLAWLLPTLTTSVLALVRVTWPGFDVREFATWGIATAPWDQARMLVTKVDVADLPYLALMRGWASLAGTTEFALRLPSVLAMAAATALVGALGSRLISPKVGLVAGLLFAAVPATTRFAQEAGPQALALFTAVLSTYSLVRMLDRPGPARTIGYGLAVAVMGVIHVTSLTLLVAHGLVLWVMRRRAFGPWVPTVLVGTLPAAALLLYRSSGWVVGTDGRPLISPDEMGMYIFGSILVAGVVVGLGVLSVSASRLSVLFAAWAVAPLVALVPLLLLTPFDPTVVLLVTLPGWVGLAALTLGHAPVIRGIGAFTAIALLALPAQTDVRRTDGHDLASRELAAVIAARIEPGDAVVYGPTPLDQRVGRDLVARYVPADRRPKDVLQLTPPRVGGSLDANECADVESCLARAPRVWLIRVGRPPGVLVDDLSATLDGFAAAKDGALRVNYMVDQVWPLTGLTLTLLTIKPISPDQVGQQ